MVEIMYKYFDSDLSESHRAKLYICTLLDPRFKSYNWCPPRKYVENALLCTLCTVMYYGYVRGQGYPVIREKLHQD
jgi:hypothetical protein